MKDIWQVKKKIKNKKRILTIVFIIFLVGLLFGSIYITILDNSNKKEIINSVKSYFNSYKNISIKDKLYLFKDILIKNLTYYISIWSLGISIIGIPIIMVMIFIKSFVTGFSISGIFSVYKMKGILGIIIYMIPSNIISILFTIFLGAYSINLSIQLFMHMIKKKPFNFSVYMGKYYLLLLISILLSILTALYEAFLNPSIINLFTKIIK